MSIEMLLISSGGAILTLVVLVFVFKKVPKGMNKDYFDRKWRETVKLLAQPATLNLAIIEADKLLDDAMKKAHFKGKTMGERMVSAQRKFSNNDNVWAAHKMRNKLVHETDVKFNENETRTALKQFQQALKDLGALL